MFFPTVRTKSFLVEGSLELNKSFAFEAAIHWAEQGHQVIYITPTPLQSFPATYHDRNEFSHEAFKLMRFMYLENYERLINQLVDLHLFQDLPSALIIDDLDTYVQDPAGQRQLDLHTARLLAFIKDSINSCARILKSLVYLCVCTSHTEIPYNLYFEDVLQLKVVSEDSNGQSFELSRKKRNDCDNENNRLVFHYRKLTDGTLILKEILEKVLI